MILIQFKGNGIKKQIVEVGDKFYCDMEKCGESNIQKLHDFIISLFEDTR